MHSPKMSIAMATLVLGLLAAPSRSAVAPVETRGRNCSSLCGRNFIPYPFGIGPECSLPGFNLTCVAGADNASNLLLGNPSINVELLVPWTLDNHFESTIVVEVTTSISYFAKLAPGDIYSVHWEAPGRPFAISGSSNMSLYVIGCGVKASFISDSGVEVGTCITACVEDQIMQRLGFVPCVGMGCCSIDITVTLRSFTLNISRTSQAARGLEQVSVFITDEPYYLFQAVGVQYRSGEYFPAKLSWAIPNQLNCKQAMADKASYACVSNHSECHEASIGGYFCNCTEGFVGNPYVVNGCVLDSGPPPPVNGTMQPRANCATSCGNVNVSFPFGIEIGCYAKLQMYLVCSPGPSPALQMLGGAVVTHLSIDQGILSVLKPSYPGNTLADTDTYPSMYAISGEWGGIDLKWAIDNLTCDNAMASKDSYRCSSYSDCIDVTDNETQARVGYRCKCSPGFTGNPYIKDGCTDIDECMQPDENRCNGICQNTFGNYTCTSCPRGTYFSDRTRKCIPSTVILGVTIGVSSAGGILFVAAAFAILTRRWKSSVQKRLRKRYFRKNKGILLEQIISSDQSARDGTKIFTFEELEKATNSFDHARVVGHGGHGTVYKGILTDQRVVAIKRSKLVAKIEIEQFINEVAILSQVNHRNVVKLHGCCLEAEIPLLVYEFIPNGTLYELLHCEQKGTLLPLPWEERLRIAVEIAGALMYLHSAASVSILHRDVKSLNVLLNDSYIAKISDFGASRSIPIDQTHLVTAVQGTFGYLDPEYYHTGQLNEKSDVYSFGVILLELLTRKKPIFENENGEKQNLSNYFLWAKGEKRPLEEVVDEQILLGEASEAAIASVAGLAVECLSLTRGDRPTMKDVEMRLQMLIRGRQQPVAPPRCDAERTGSGGRGGAVPVPAAARQHGSRQYSLEQEFLSSSRVPR